MFHGMRILKFFLITLVSIFKISIFNIAWVWKNICFYIAGGMYIFTASLESILAVGVCLKRTKEIHQNIINNLL